MKKVKVKILKAFDNKSLGSFTTIVDDENYDFEIVEPEDISIGAFEVVEELPDNPKKSTIYLLKNSVETEQNYYDEYIYLEDETTFEGHWELIGSTQVDLSNYYTKDQVYDKTEINNTLNSYELKSEAFSGDYDDLTDKPDLSVYELKSEAFSGDYNDLTNKPTIPVVPTNVSAFTNDAGYLTEHQDISGKQDEIEDLDAIRAGATLGSTAVQPEVGKGLFSGNYNDLTNKPTIPAEQIQSDWSQTTTTAKDYIKNKPNLATVATSGSYNDLSNKPTIPTAVSQLSNDRYIRYDISSQGLSTTQKSNARTNIGAASSADLANKVSSTTMVTFNGAYREGDQEIGSLVLHNVAETGSFNDLRDAKDIIKAFDSSYGLKDLKIELVHGFETSNIYGVDCLSLNNEYSYDYGYLKISYEVTSLTAELNLFYSAFGGVQDAYISMIDTALTQDTSTDYYGDIYAHCDLTASSDPYEKPSVLSFKLDNLGGLGKHFVTFKVITSSSPYGPFFYLDLKNKESLIHYDSVPTEGSDNLVTSGGIYDAIQQGGGGSLDAYTKAETNELLTVSENRIEELIEGGPTPGGDWSSNWVAHVSEIPSSEDLPQSLRELIDTQVGYASFRYLGSYNDSTGNWDIVSLDSASGGALYLVRFNGINTLFKQVNLSEINGSSPTISNIVFTSEYNQLYYFDDNQKQFYKGYIISPDNDEYSVNWNQLSFSGSIAADDGITKVACYTEFSSLDNRDRTRLILIGSSAIYKVEVEYSSVSNYVSISVSIPGKQVIDYNSVDDYYTVGQFSESGMTLYKGTANWDLLSFTVEDSPAQDITIANLGYWNKDYIISQDISVGLDSSSFKAYYWLDGNKVEETIESSPVVAGFISVGKDKNKNLNAVYYDSSNYKLKVLEIKQEGNCPWVINTSKNIWDSQATGEELLQAEYLGKYENVDYYLGSISNHGGGYTAILLKMIDNVLTYLGTFNSTDTARIFVSQRRGEASKVKGALAKDGYLYLLGTTTWGSGTPSYIQDFAIVKRPMSEIISDAESGQIDVGTNPGRATLVYSGTFTSQSYQEIDIDTLDFEYNEQDQITKIILYPAALSNSNSDISNILLYKIDLLENKLQRYSFNWLMDEEAELTPSSFINWSYVGDNKLYISFYKYVDTESVAMEGIFEMSDSSTDPESYPLVATGIRTLPTWNKDNLSFAASPTIWNANGVNYLFCAGKYEQPSLSLYQITTQGLDRVSDLIFDHIDSAFAQARPVLLDNKVLRISREYQGAVATIYYILTTVEYNGQTNIDSNVSNSDTTSFENTLINLFAVADDRYASKGDTPTPTPTPVGEQKYLHEVYLQYIWGEPAMKIPTVVKFTIIDNVNNPYTAARLMERVGTLGNSLSAIEVTPALSGSYTETRLYRWTLRLDSSSTSVDYPYILDNNTGLMYSQILGYDLVDETKTTVDDIITPL